MSQTAPHLVGQLHVSQVSRGRQALAEDMPQLTCWISCIARRMEEWRRGKARWLSLSLSELGFVLPMFSLCWFWQSLVLLNHTCLRTAATPDCREGLLVEGLEGQGCSSGGVSPSAASAPSVRHSRSS